MALTDRVLVISWPEAVALWQCTCIVHLRRGWIRRNTLSLSIMNNQISCSHPIYQQFAPTSHWHLVMEKRAHNSPMRKQICFIWDMQSIKAEIHKYATSVLFGYYFSMISSKMRNVSCFESSFKWYATDGVHIPVVLLPLESCRISSTEKKSPSYIIHAIVDDK